MTNTSSYYSGVWTALVSPMNQHGQLDMDAFKNIVKIQIASGVKGVIPCGTTGESPTLTEDEKKELIRIALDTCRNSSTLVFAGTGGNDTATTVALSSWASKRKVHGLLIVTPYYNKPSPAGLEKHFLAVADAVECPVMLYNVPGRTGVSLTAESIVRLAKHQRINALKEATANIAFTSEIIARLKAEKQEIAILSGDDATFLPLLSVGACGVVSVSSNLFPKEMVSLCDAYFAGNIAKAREIHQKYYPLFRDLFIESNPGPIKSAMARSGFIQDHIRLPLTHLSPVNQEILSRTLSECGFSAPRSHP